MSSAQPETPQPRSVFAQLLDFDRDGDVFIARNAVAGRDDRLFGGLIAAQALGAAGATVTPDQQPHSLHGYFIRGGRYGVEVVLGVDRIRDGKSFSTRRVTVTQRGVTIFEMTASFHRPETGADEHPPMRPPLNLDDSVPAGLGLPFARPFEIRVGPESPTQWAIPPFWIRTREPVEDDPLLRACILTLLSDIGLVPVARPPGTPLRFDTGFAASLDHSVWFHRPFDPHRWHCYDVAPLNHTGARGLVRGSLYDTDNTLMASTAQEALWRL